MRFLMFSSLLLIFTCNAQYILSQKTVKVTGDKDSTGLYHLGMSILNRDVSGLLVFKQRNDSSFRVVLTSEMGPKILDMNIFPDHYELNFAISQLKKKRVLNSFFNDFAAISGVKSYGKRGILTETDSMLNSEFVYSKKEILRISNSKNRDYSYAGFYKKNKKLWEIHYFYKNDMQADSVFLKHSNFNLKMELRKIEM